MKRYHYFYVGPNEISGIGTVDDGHGNELSEEWFKDEVRHLRISPHWNVVHQTDNLVLATRPTATARPELYIIVCEQKGA